jgi:peroxin-7
MTIITLGMNAPPKILRTKTPGFAHHSLAFSPFFEDRIAVASGANFGLVGNGRVHILSLTPGGLGVVKW